MPTRLIQIYEESYETAWTRTREHPDVFDAVLIGIFSEAIINEAASFLIGAVEVHNQKDQDLLNIAAKKMKEYFLR